jgi:hypothetical protein
LTIKDKSEKEVYTPNVKANEATLCWTNVIDGDDIHFTADYGFIAGGEQIIIINSFYKKGKKEYKLNKYPIVLPKDIILELLQADWYEVINERKK